MTDRRRLAPAPAGRPEDQLRCLLDQIRAAVDAGVDVVQIRERDLEAAALAALTRAIVGIARGTSTRVVVNDRVDIALACGADGVHLRSDSVPPSAVRAAAPAGFLIGRSVHGVDEAMSAASNLSAMAATGAADVDYLIAGTVWPTESKPPGSPLLGEAGLAAVVRAARVPVLAIGGVTPERAAAVAAAGASGVAGIGLFMSSPGAAADPACRATALGAPVAALRSRFAEPR